MSTRRKRGGKSNGDHRIEQLSFFDILEMEESELAEEVVEREEPSTILHTGNDQDTGEQVGLAGAGSEPSLQSGAEGDRDRESSGETPTAGTDSSGEQSDGESQRDYDGMADEPSGDESTVLERIRLESNSDVRLSVRDKIQNNIRAIETLDTLAYENRQAYAEEQTILSGFSGWGGCPQIFNEKDSTYALERRHLKELLSVEEYQNARSSTLTSFYTPLNVIEMVYRVVDRLGFEQGKILEPSMGTGNFIGMMPETMFDNSIIKGIELDDISASIASHLYPSVEVLNMGFEESPYPDNAFDLVISNVPFGNYQVYDREFERYHYNIHNYFFAKSLQKVRDGGLIAFITSSETMDGNSTIMRYIDEQADFLGAIRLPNNTFKQNGANTEVTSDIIFLQKHLNKEYTHTQSYTEHIPFEHRQINKYFAEHPEMVWGTIVERKNQFGTYELTTMPDEKTLEEHFEEVLDTFHPVYTERKEEVSESYYKEIDADHARLAIDSFFVQDDQLFYRDETHYYPLKPKEEVHEIALKADHVFLKNNTEIDKVKRLIVIADTAKEVIEAQVRNVKEEIYLDLRNKLNEQYDAFIKDYGAMHKKTNLPLLGDDPRVSLLTTLEDYEPKTKVVTKAPLFTERTIKPNIEVKEVENVLDGLRLSLNNKGGIDIPYIALLYGKEEDETLNELLEKRYIFIEPETQEMVLADDYLSGNIRKKLREARAYNATNNIEALESVMPEELKAEDITIQLGSTWVPEEYVREFILDLFQIESDWQRNSLEVQYDNIAGTWVLSPASRWSDVVRLDWGVPKSPDISYPIRQPDYDGYDLVENVLNSKIPTVRDYWDEWNDNRGEYVTKSRINPERTMQAQSLAERLNDAWEEWVYANEERKQHLVSLYNEIFNSIRLQEYDGSYLTFPEMSMSIQLEPYQKNAVARIMNPDNNTLLWQKVGAGKTFEMIAAGMEMKRLGIRNKILYVVPNHLISQWHNEFVTLYPRANVLVATKRDFAKERRMAFVNRMATGNYDAIIMAHSSFGLIDVSNETRIAFEQQELDEITNAIEQLREEGYSSTQTQRVKILERTKKQIENRIKRLVDSPRDNNLIPFEDLGIDFLFVDESQEFKNLYMYTAMQNVVGLQTASSKKAYDMFLKCQIIGKNGGGICFASGTPVTNTMAELYTLQRFLQKSYLEELNIRCFDAWAKAFGRTVQSFEISIDGNNFVNRTRFAKFFNVQELMTGVRQFAEIQTEKMLREELEKSTVRGEVAIPPKHIGGKPQVISIEPSEELKLYMENIVERSEAIHNGNFDPKVDNMLKITTDSKKASIDMRLIDPAYSNDPNGKLAVIAKQVFAIYEEYNDVKGTQLIFCDFSTPRNEEKEGEFSDVYHELQNKMMALGIPKEEIAFIHDYNTEARKEKLFSMMNEGKMRVLLGSTPKLGAGTNVQKRLIAVHHVDVPWKASDIEQQNGRAFRQGNMFDEIYEFRYVTKQSFDAYSWQIVETKATYTEQLLEGANGMREFEEDNQTSFSFAEVKAIASGNPIIKEKFEVDNEVKRLEGLKKAFRRTKLKAQEQLVKLPAEIMELKSICTRLAKDADYFDSYLYPESEIDQKFTFTSETGKVYRTMKEAWEAVKALEQGMKYGEQKRVGTFLGAEVSLVRDAGYVSSLHIQTPTRDLRIDDTNPVGRVNFVRILKRVTEIGDNLNRRERELETKEHNLKTVQVTAQSTFPQEEELVKMRYRQREIDKQLEATDNEKLSEAENSEMDKCDEFDEKEF